MSKDIYETWKDTIAKIANSVARDFPDIEQEDISQSLWLFVIERQWRNPDDKNQTLVLRRVARSAAMKMRTEQLGVTSQYSYRTSEVREVLELVFDHNDWPRRSVPVYQSDISGAELPQWELVDWKVEGMEREGIFNRKGRLDPGLTTNVLSHGISRPAVDFDDKISAFTDVKSAWMRLPEQYRRAIFVKYALQQQPETVAERRRLERAVSRLTDILNWYWRT